MQTYYTILTVFYYIFAVVIAIFIAWNFYKDRKISNKIIGAIALLMFLYRIFMIR